MPAAFSGALDLSALKRPPAPTPPSTAPGAPAAAETTQENPAGTSTRSPYVIDVDEAGFATNVVDLSSQVLVVISLWASWSEPSLQLTPLLEKVVIEQNGAVVLARVDVDANPRIAQALQIQSVPTVVAIAAGQPVDVFSGPQPEPQLRGWLASLVDALRDRLPGMARAGAPLPPEPEPEDERFTAAEDAFAAGDYDAAVAAYEAILAVEPANAEAKAAIGQVRFQARVEALPSDAVALADADPVNVTLQMDAADVELANGRAEVAFDRLIRTVRTSAGEDRTALRDHLVGLFALIGSDAEIVVAARRKLAAALY